MTRLREAWLKQRQAFERELVASGDACQMCRCALYGNGRPQMCRDCDPESTADERETDPCDLSKREREERE